MSNLEEYGSLGESWESGIGARRVNSARLGRGSRRSSTGITRGDGVDQMP